jgi:hypothetical protein
MDTIVRLGDGDIKYDPTISCKPNRTLGLLFTVGSDNIFFED